MENFLEEIYFDLIMKQYKQNCILNVVERNE